MKRNPIFYRNDLPAHIVARNAAQLIEEAGLINDESATAARAARGFCVAEIARAQVRREFPKGSSERRRYLTALTKLGCPPPRERLS